MTNTTGKPDVVTFLLFGKDFQGNGCLVGNLRSLVYFQNGEERQVSNGGCASMLGEHFEPGEDLMDAALRGAYEEWAPEDMHLTRDSFRFIGEIETGKTYNYLVAPQLPVPLTLKSVHIGEGYGPMFLPISHIPAAKRANFLTEASFTVLKVLGEDDELVSALQKIYIQMFGFK